MVANLAVLTGADVAASTDLTGAASRGGDWSLEHRTGEIAATTAPSFAARSEWQGLMATFNVTSTGDSIILGSLRWAITQANLSLGSDTIVLGPGTYTLSLPNLLARRRQPDRRPRHRRRRLDRRRRRGQHGDRRQRPGSRVRRAQRRRQLLRVDDSGRRDIRRRWCRARGSRRQRQPQPEHPARQQRGQGRRNRERRDVVAQRRRDPQQRR